VPHPSLLNIIDNRPVLSLIPGFEILYKKHTKKGQVQQVLVKIDLFGGLSYLVINYIAYEAEAGKSQAVDNSPLVLRMLEPDEREKRKLAAEMAATDMFAEFSSDDLSIISGYAGICEVPAGAVVLREGESNPKLCLILDQSVTVQNVWWRYYGRQRTRRGYCIHCQTAACAATGPVAICETRPGDRLQSVFRRVRQCDDRNDWERATAVGCHWPVRACIEFPRP